MRFVCVVGLAAGLLSLGTVANAAAEVFSTGGFEGYDIGTVVGQSIAGGASGGAVWQSDSAGEADPDVVLDPTASGRGKVLRLDPKGQTTRTWTGAWLGLDDLVAKGHKQVVVSWDQYRTTLNQAIFSNDAPDLESWFAFEFPLAFGGPRLYPNGIVSDPGLLLKSGVWQTVTIGLDFETHRLWGRLSDASSPQGDLVQNIEFEGDMMRGVNFEAFGTDLGAPNGPNYIDGLVVKGGTDEIPEPASAALLAAGLSALVARRRRAS
jgi:hypothetical protein